MSKKFSFILTLFLLLILLPRPVLSQTTSRVVFNGGEAGPTSNGATCNDVCANQGYGFQCYDVGTDSSASNNKYFARDSTNNSCIELSGTCSNFIENTQGTIYCPAGAIDRHEVQWTNCLCLTNQTVPTNTPVPTLVPTNTPIPTPTPIPGSANLTRKVFLQKATTASYDFRWVTNTQNQLIVKYGLTTSYGSQVTSDAEQLINCGNNSSFPCTGGNNNHAKITGLAPNTSYYYQVTTTTGTALTPAGDPNHYFKTPPAVGSSTPFTWAIWGDSGDNGTRQNNVAKQVFAKRPDVTIVAGDIAYPYSTSFSNNNTLYFDRYSDASPGQNTMSFSPFYVTCGNHETSCPTVMADHSLPGGGKMSSQISTYAFDYGNVHFVALNSNSSYAYNATNPSASDPQVAWAYNNLITSNQPWKVVYWHHNGWSAGSHSTNTAIIDNLIRMASDAGADLVLWGHSHVFERWNRKPGFYPNVQAYTIGNGGKSGSSSCTSTSPGPGCAAKSASGDSDAGFLYFQVNGDTMTASYIDQTGVNRDTITLNSGGVGPTNTPGPSPTSGPTPTRTPTPIPPTPTPSGAPTPTQPSTGEIDIAVCDRANGPFSLNINNPYFPLPVGLVHILEGGGLKVQFSVLNQTKVIGGITTRVIEEREWLNGTLVEVSNNWFVQAPNGTVCYYGEDVFDGNGNPIAGSWIAYDDPAHPNFRPGIIMPASPAVGQSYYQEFAPGFAEDRALHISFGTYTVPAGTFNNVLLVNETPPSTKRYAPGVGLIYDDGAVLTSLGPTISPTPIATIKNLLLSWLSSILDQNGDFKVNSLDFASLAGPLPASTPSPTLSPTATTTAPTPTRTPIPVCYVNLTSQGAGGNSFYSRIFNDPTKSTANATISSISLTWPYYKGQLQKITLAGVIIWTGSTGSCNSTTGVCTATISSWSTGNRVTAVGQTKDLVFLFSGNIIASPYILATTFYESCSASVTWP